MDFNLEQLFSSYGQSAVLEDSEEWSSNPFYCFIQPLRYKNKMYLDGVNTSIGFNNEGHYLYIGPPEHDLTLITDSNTWLKCHGQKYKIDRAEKVYIGSDVLYIWAIIRKIVEVE